MKIILQPNMVVFTYFCFLHSAVKRNFEFETDQDRNVEHQDLNITDMGDQQSCILKKLLVTASFKSKKLRVLENEPVEPETCVNQQKLYSIKPCDSGSKHDDPTSSSTANGEESSLDMNSSEEHLDSGNDVSTPNSNAKIDKTIKYESIAVQTDNDSIPVNLGRKNACKSCGIPNCFYCTVFRDLGTSSGRITQNENEVVPIEDFEAFREHYMDFKEEAEGSILSNRSLNHIIRSSEINFLGYNLFYASKLDVAVKKKVVNMYGEKCETNKDKRKRIRQYLINHRNENIALPKFATFSAESELKSIKTYIESIRPIIGALQEAYTLNTIEKEGFGKFVINYKLFLSNLRNLRNLTIYMSEFIFYIENRIKTFHKTNERDFGAMCKILEEYQLLKDVLYNYEVLKQQCLVDSENAPLLTDMKCPIDTTTKKSSVNDITDTNHPYSISDKCKNLDESIRKLRVFAMESIFDIGTNCYFLHECAMKNRYEFVKEDYGYKGRGEILFILAYTQKTQINIQDLAKKGRKRQGQKFNTNLSAFMDNNSHFKENAVLTLQLVVKYLCNNQGEETCVTLLSPQRRINEYLLIKTADACDIKWKKFVGIHTYFLSQLHIRLH